jgi:hypothetical protein
MTAVSPTPIERARKATSVILRAMQDPGRQVAIATAMGVSESTVSRMKNDQLEQFCLLLAHAGLKVVPIEMQCFPADKVQALLTLARDHLAAIERPDQLVWE